MLLLNLNRACTHNGERFFSDQGSPSSAQEFRVAEH
jgi:hypothetical protein